MSIFKPVNPAARPLGSRTRRAPRGQAGLGYASTIPGACWDVPGFNDCHASAFAQAQKDCTSSEVSANWNGDTDLCVDTLADEYSGQSCIPKYCPQTQPTVQSGGLPASQVTAIQTAVNKVLAANGFKPIAVDGKMGPATCGAATYVKLSFADGTFDAYNMGAYCGSAMTMPTKVGSTVPESQIVVTADGPQSPAWGVVTPGLSTVQQTINAALTANGYNPIPVDSKLGPETCGAMQWLKQTTGQDYMSTYGGNCQSFTMPTKKGGGSVAPQPGVGPTPVVPVPKKGITQATMLTGGLMLAAAGGLYYWAKKKGMV